VSRAVLDTNIYISAYGFGGKPAELLRRAIEGEFELVASPALLLEVAEKLESVLGFDRAHTEEVVRQIARIATVVRPEARIAVLSDDADNRVLEAAVDSDADTIVSGDHHLLDLAEHEGIRIVRVSEYLGTLDRAAGAAAPLILPRVTVRRLPARIRHRL
jgi:putative PIN family toxin of toxin-antitoxin system